MVINLGPRGPEVLLLMSERTMITSFTNKDVLVVRVESDIILFIS
jgi:hypothetical protein